MEIVFILVPVSLVLMILACYAFVWSVRHHQFDNLDREAERILFEKGDDDR